MTFLFIHNKNVIRCFSLAKPKLTTPMVAGYEEIVPLFITSRSETDLAFTGSDSVTSVILSTYELLSSNHTPKQNQKFD